MAEFAQDHSKSPPPSGALEVFLRRFARFSYAIVVLLVYVLASAALGLALAPVLWGWHWLSGIGANWMPVLHWIWLGFVGSLCFFGFGLHLIFVVPLFNFLLPTRVKPFKGGYYQLKAVPWFLHNALFYLVRFTFLPFVTLTPFGVWFLKAMGMKIGRHAFINTEYISDPQLITIGDDAALGGSVRIFAHYGGGGNLVVAPILIGDKATLGAGCCVMGDVEIGERAVILPQSVVLPGSRVPAGETWGGIPARRITRDEMDMIKKDIRGIEG
jgi:acetyltransferase-like isoleucine patch superfamily enzyme